MASNSVCFTVELSDAEAWAYAQFLKRVGFQDYQANAEDKDQAYLMRDAGFKVQQAMADAGYAPR